MPSPTHSGHLLQSQAAYPPSALQRPAHPSTGKFLCALSSLQTSGHTGKAAAGCGLGPPHGSHSLQRSILQETDQPAVFMICSSLNNEDFAPWSKCARTASSLQKLRSQPVVLEIRVPCATTPLTCSKLVTSACAAVQEELASSLPHTAADMPEINGQKHSKMAKLLMTLFKKSSVLEVMAMGCKLGPNLKQK